MRLVDDEQAHRRGEQREHLVTKARVVEPLGTDQQQVDGIGGQQVADRAPLAASGAVDGVGPQSQALGGGDLVAHQRQQRADDQGRAGARLPQQSGGDEVHRRLPPASALHAQHPGAILDEVPDRLQLSGPEIGAVIVGQRAQALQGVGGKRSGDGGGHDQTMVARPADGPATSVTSKHW
jgi:hypothetical protein